MKDCGTSAGIDTSYIEGLSSWKGPFYNNCLYYENGKLTDKPYIKFPVLFQNNSFINKGIVKLICYGPVKKGDFLSTYFLYGTCFSSGNEFEEPAFAKALQDKFSDGIDLIDAEFLQQPYQI